MQIFNCTKNKIPQAKHAITILKKRSLRARTPRVSGASQKATSSMRRKARDRLPSRTTRLTSSRA